jgi:hypothetical protein
MRPAALPPTPPSPPRDLKPEEPPSYLWAMLTHPININLGLLSAAAATFLAIPFGLAGAALPLLAFGAGESIASMFIPSSATFRNNVDRKWKLRRRMLATEHLQREIARRARDKDPRWQVHARLRERIQSLGEMIRHRQSGIAERDIDKLEDAAVDYLGLWLADLSMVERQSAVDEAEIERRIAEIGKRMEGGAADARSLQKARSDLEELLIRHRRLASRKSAVEAALLSLPDAVEEIYHAVVTTPASGEGGARLQEAIERLRLEEELESSYGAEIRDILPQKAARAALHVVKQ